MQARAKELGTDSSQRRLTTPASTLAGSSAVDCGVTGTSPGRCTKPACRQWTDRWYKMDHRRTAGRRGICLIINNINFDVGPERDGSKKDSETIERVFSESLHFDVVQRYDCSSEDISALLDTYARHDHTDSDCFACFVLSHGGEGTISCTKGTQVEVQYICSRFTDTACTSLAGKPKLFFIQACQGHRADEGDSPINPPSGDRKGSIRALHLTPDFFVFNSTSPGYVSLRHRTDGSYFIQHLCEVLETHHSTKDFATMMRLVKLHVSDIDVPIGHQRVKQMPYAASTLTKNILWMPQPLQVLVLTEQEGYQLKLEVFEDLMWKDVEDLPALIISVTGILKSGKSLLLNYLVRYLDWMETDATIEGWMGDPDEPLTGFAWKCGPIENTYGIFIWHKIFRISTPSGPVAVVLMDVEGISHDTSHREAERFPFLLSMIPCSTLIYNVIKTPRQNFLKQVWRSWISVTLLLSATAKTRKPSQNRVVVVRDWDCEEQIPYGLDAERKIIHGWLRSNEHDTRARNIDCFLMPHPGAKLGSKSFDGRCSDLSEEFKVNLGALVRSLFSRERLAPRRVDGQIFTCRDFISFFKESFSVYAPSRRRYTENVVTWKVVPGHDAQCGTIAFSADAIEAALEGSVVAGLPTAVLCVVGGLRGLDSNGGFPFDTFIRYLEKRTNTPTIFVYDPPETTPPEGGYVRLLVCTKVFEIRTSEDRHQGVVLMDIEFDDNLEPFKVELHSKWIPSVVVYNASDCKDSVGRCQVPAHAPVNESFLLVHNWGAPDWLPYGRQPEGFKFPFIHPAFNQPEKLCTFLLPRLGGHSTHEHCRGEFLKLLLQSLSQHQQKAEIDKDDTTQDAITKAAERHEEQLAVLELHPHAEKLEKEKVEEKTGQTADNNSITCPGNLGTGSQDVDGSSSQSAPCASVSQSKSFVQRFFAWPLL